MAAGFFYVWLFNVEPKPQKKMDPVLEGLIEKFLDLDEESQKNVIKNLKREGEDELVKTLEKIRRIKKRTAKMDDLVDQILDKLE